MRIKRRLKGDKHAETTIFAQTIASQVNLLLESYPSIEINSMKNLKMMNPTEKTEDQIT